MLGLLMAKGRWEEDKESMSRDMDATKMFGTPNSVFNMPSYIKAETNHLTKGSSDGAQNGHRQHSQR